MTREKVRSFKRALRASRRPDATAGDTILAKDSALCLLARSIDFGQCRLAVLRLAIAVDSGARVPGEHWLYCARVAEASKDLCLQELYLSAAATATRHTAETV